MAYILNLTLGCWLSLEEADLTPYGSYWPVKELVPYWNSCPNSWPFCIHYPCIAEQFEEYEELPEEWNNYVHT